MVQSDGKLFHIVLGGATNYQNDFVCCACDHIEYVCWLDKRGKWVSDCI